MDNRQIGVFDSGIGGLSAVRVLEELLPNEDIVYFGDSARMPYGGKSRDEIVSNSMQVARFLEERGVKAALIACGTITSNAIENLRKAFDFPFFGVVCASCEAAVKATKVKKVGVIATEATIKSGVFDAGITELDPSVKVLSRACPGFAPLVESGHFLRGDRKAEASVRSELGAFLHSGIDTLLLGCTHYPLLADVISDFLGEAVTLISSGGEAAKELKRHLESAGMLKDSERPGVRHFYTSGNVDVFSKSAANFLGHEISALRHEI